MFYKFSDHILSPFLHFKELFPKDYEMLQNFYQSKFQKIISTIIHAFLAGSNNVLGWIWVIGNTPVGDGAN